MNSNLFGKCKQCNNKRHCCSSCGIEAWYYTFCSEACLKSSGNEQCPTCHGWGMVDDVLYPDLDECMCRGEGYIPIDREDR